MAHSSRYIGHRVAGEVWVEPKLEIETARRINEIVHGKRAITADTALRLGRYFKMSPEFWLNLQAIYDLEVEKERLAGKLAQTVRVYAA